MLSPPTVRGSLSCAVPSKKIMVTSGQGIITLFLHIETKALGDDAQPGEAEKVCLIHLLESGSRLLGASQSR